MTVPKGLYIGDGVWVYFDGYHVVLNTDNGTLIFLASTTWDNLVEFVDSVNVDA